MDLQRSAYEGKLIWSVKLDEMLSTAASQPHNLTVFLLGRRWSGKLKGLVFGNLTNMNQVDNKGLFRCSGHQSTLDSPAVATKREIGSQSSFQKKISNVKLCFVCSEQGKIQQTAVFCVQRARQDTANCYVLCAASKTRYSKLLCFVCSEQHQIEQTAVFFVQRARQDTANCCVLCAASNTR